MEVTVSPSKTPLGLLAIWNEDDQWHTAAEEAFGRIVEQRDKLLSTTYVIAECGNAVARHSFRRDVVDLGNSLEAVGCLIVPTPEDWQMAWHAYSDGYPGGPGLVDELSFSIMRRLGLRLAFTTDRHFRSAGFEPLF